MGGVRKAFGEVGPACRNKCLRTKEYSVLQIVGVVGIGINSGRGRGQPGPVLGSLSDGLQSLDCFYIREQTLKGFGQRSYCVSEDLSCTKIGVKESKTGIDQRGSC